MKALVLCTLSTGLLSILPASPGIAAEPLSAEAMEAIQIAQPSSLTCRGEPYPGRQGKSASNECPNTEELKTITDHSLREILEAEPATQVPHSSKPQLPTTPDTTYQQQQAIDIFMRLPWGR